MTRVNVAGVEISTEHWIGGKRVASQTNVRGSVADRRRAPRGRLGGRRGRGRRRGVCRARGVSGVGGVRCRRDDSRSCSASRMESRRARRSSRRSRPPTTARCCSETCTAWCRARRSTSSFFAEFAAHQARWQDDRLTRSRESRALRSRWCRRTDYAVECAAHADDVEGRAGARRGEHRGREAAGVGAAHLLAARRHRARGGRAGRRAERGAGHRRRGRRGARRACGRRPHQLHRLDRHREADRRRRLRDRSLRSRRSSAGSRRSSSAPTPISTLPRRRSRAST